MPRHVAVIARYTLLEAWRSGFFWLLLALVALQFGVALFLSHVSITESAEIRRTVVAAGARLSAVFILAVFAVFSTAREFHERGIDYVLALPVSRAAYLLGRGAGLAICGAIVAAAFAACAASLGGGVASAFWGLSLALEVWLVTAFALFCVITLAQPVSALVACGGFYILARSINTFLLIAASSTVGDPSWSDRLADWVIRGIALIVPRMDHFTRTEWLLAGSPTAPEIAACAVQTCVYVLLITAAALFDLYRREF
jgi:ABC-type transport system involved in multi-copper enzyme maturation permease subunit